MNITEISIQSLHSKMQSKEQFVILDVREYLEIEKVNLDDSRIAIVPMSQIAQKGIDVFPEELQNKETEIIIICHHGIRSAQVTNWLSTQGWKKIYSLKGGINAFAQQIDQSIGFY
jgi:rhodanese-related sulfurtransferase